MFTRRYGHVDSDESARGDQEQGLAVPAAHPLQHKESGNFGRNFNSPINELCEVNIDAKAGDFEADPIVEEGNCKPARRATSQCQHAEKRHVEGSFATRTIRIRA